MKTLTKRVLTTVIGFPLLVAIVFFLPQANNLAFCLLVFVVAIMGSYEMRAMLEKHFEQHFVFPPWAGSLLIVAQYIEKAFFPTYSLVLYVLAALLIITYIFEAILGYKYKDEYKESMNRMAYSTISIIYPNLFGTFLIHFAFVKNPSLMIILLFVGVFGCDIFAYIFGMLFGKGSRGIVKVSPKKSLAGFIGGVLTASLFTTLFVLFIPAFELEWYVGLLLGFATSIAAIFGDLIESTFKRSVEVKDSGNFVPGRGGILDSVDSLIIGAPAFICILFLFAG